jgi:hypothetical protein
LALQVGARAGRRGAGLGRGPPASSGPLHPTRSRGSTWQVEGAARGAQASGPATRPPGPSSLTARASHGATGPRARGSLRRITMDCSPNWRASASCARRWVHPSWWAGCAPAWAGHESTRHTECVNWHKNAPHHATQPRLRVWYSVCQCLSALLRRLEKRASDGTALAAAAPLAPVPRVPCSGPVQSWRCPSPTARPRACVDETVKEGEPKVERKIIEMQRKTQRSTALEKVTATRIEGGTFFERASERGRKITSQSSPIH